MIVKRERHDVNGRFYGMFYYADNGKVIYLAHRSASRTRGIFSKTNSWCIDKITLSRCRSKKVSYVGVVQKIGRNHWIWVSLIEDWELTARARKHPEGDTNQLAMPLTSFRIDPSTSADYIAAQMKL